MFSSAATHTGDVQAIDATLLNLRSAFSDLIISRVPRTQGLFEKSPEFIIRVDEMQKKMCENDITSAPKINSLHVGLQCGRRGGINDESGFLYKAGESIACNIVAE